MADPFSKDQRSKLMSKIRSKNTKGEVMLSKSLWNRNIRYRKHNKKIFGIPDISITSLKLAIFVDSEFFHGKDWETKKRPINNAEFWAKKIARNIERDKEVNEYLENNGWTVLRFWSEEIQKNLDEVVATIERHVILKKSRMIKIYPDDDITLGNVAEENPRG